MKVDADFENGSLGWATIITDDWCYLTLREDTYFWFHFRISGCRNQNVTFSFRTRMAETNSSDCWRPRGPNDLHQPVISYDRHTWEKIDAIEIDKGCYPHGYRFRIRLREDPAYICYDYPYTYSDLNDYLDTIRDESRVDVGRLGETHAGRVMPLVTLGNPESRNLVLLINRENASESAGSYAVEGIINHLIGANDDLVRDVLNRCVFMIVPMVSIEGVVCGAVDGGAFGVLAQNWADNPAAPEVENIKRGLTDWLKSGYRLVLAGKIHGGHEYGPYARWDYGSSDPQLRRMLDTDEWNPYPARDNMTVRPVGMFERYINDEYDFSSVFGTHAQGIDPDHVRKKGESFAKALLSFIRVKTR